MSNETQLPTGADQAPDRDVHIIPMPILVRIVRSLYMAFTNLHLYSWSHPATRNQIQRGWAIVDKAVQEHGEVLLCTAGGKIFWRNEFLEEGNRAVERLARHLESLGVASVTFTPEMNCDEYEQFCRLLAATATEIEETGGAVKMFEREAVEGIKLNSTVYKLIHDDEKIVEADFEEGMGEEERVEFRIVAKFVDDMLKSTQNPAELLKRMKDDPNAVANQIGKLLNYADGVLDEDRFNEILSALRKNIESATVHNKSPVLRAIPKEEREMAKAFSQVEQELKKHAKRMSSGKALEFIKNIGKMVSNCSDISRAESVLAEFLKSGRSIEDAMAALKEVSSDADTSHQILQRLETIAGEQQLEIDELLDAVAKNIRDLRQKKRRRRKRSTPLRKLLHKTLDSDFPEVTDKDKLVGVFHKTISRHITGVIKAKTAALTDRVEELETGENTLKAILESIPLGIVVVDETGLVQTVVHGNLMPEFEEGKRLPMDLLTPLRGLTDETIAEYKDIQIIEASKTVEGWVNAFLFVPAQEE